MSLKNITQFFNKLIDRITNKNITQLFNKFAGRVVPMTETRKTLDLGGTVFDFVAARLIDPNDPTLEEMKKLANDNGLKLRVWLPDTIGTLDYHSDRVNAHIKKGRDGKYRVGGRFNIG